MCSDPAPFFPSELEREMLETVAHLYPHTIPTLLLVSKRAYEWITRISYKVVTPDGAQFTLPTLALKQAIRTNSHPRSFFRDRVRHLALPVHEETTSIAEILSTCSEVQNLFAATFIDPLVINAVAMRPRRLSIYMIFDEVHRYQALFTSVTHLNLMVSAGRPPWAHVDVATRWQPFFALLPALTHLSLYLEVLQLPVVETILVLCQDLSILAARHPRPPTLSKKRFTSIEDDRLVNLSLPNPRCIDDWVTGVKGRMDFWACAEAFVAMKRRGEIEPGSRCWIEEADGLGSQYCV
ncbi:hypothetical protein C8R47DRAFT_1134553 [Mycena vitilis]|nr:hypothetical protein C8R47DRAFT_1134553 [Mycena vitilis]